MHHREYVVDVSNNIYWICGKRDESFQRFVNLPSEKSEFGRTVISPHLDHANHFSIYWHSKSHEPKVIGIKLESAPGHSISPDRTVTD
jgi:hypothetical protein